MHIGYMQIYMQNLGCQIYLIITPEPMTEFAQIRPTWFYIFILFLDFE